MGRWRDPLPASVRIPRRRARTGRRSTAVRLRVASGNSGAVAMQRLHGQTRMWRPPLPPVRLVSQASTGRSGGVSCVSGCGMFSLSRVAKKVAGSLLAAIVSGELPSRRKRLARAATSLGLSSKPEPRMRPMGERAAAEASASSAATTDLVLKPRCMAPSTTRKSAAAWRVSRSPKASTTSGSKPARRADCASARPENAAIRTDWPTTL